MLLPGSDPSHFCHILLAKKSTWLWICSKGVKKCCPPSPHPQGKRTSPSAQVHSCRPQGELLMMPFYWWVKCVKDRLHVHQATVLSLTQTTPFGTHHLTTVFCCRVPLHWEPKWWSKIAWITLGNGAGGLLNSSQLWELEEGALWGSSGWGPSDPGRVLRRYGRAVPSTRHQGWRYGMDMECPFSVWPDPTEPSATPSAPVGVPDLATNLRFTLEAASVNWTSDISPLLLTALYSTWFPIMGWGWGLLFPACWSLRSQTMGIIFMMLEYLTLLT